MITYEAFEQQWLEEVLKESPSMVERGHRFAEKILRDWHEIDTSSAEVILCDGAGDGGIDAAIFVKGEPEEGIEGDTWMLFQSKLGSTFGGADAIGIEAQKLFATLEGKRDRLSGLSAELVARLRNFLSNRGPKDRIEYVLATQRKLSAEELEYLANVRTLGRAKFGDCFDVDSVSIETIYRKLEEADAFGHAKIAVSLTTTVASSDETLLIGATKLTDVFAFMQEYALRAGDLDLLYEKNVRKFLGHKRKVNRGIETTIDKYPERFGLYNNGITIVTEELERTSPDKLLLKNPFIVNGCQTTRSIWSVLQRRLNSGGTEPSPAQRDWEAKLNLARVVTKIVVVGAAGEELLTETTRYTNSQNTVGEKDFIALEKDFRTWGPLFNSKFGVFLEIQRGAWEARRAYQRQHPLATPRYEESANAFELLKVYAAGWLQEAGVAFGKNPPFAPGGSLFNRIVNQDGFGIDSLHAAYLLQKLAATYGFGRGAATLTRGQTKFLFMLVATELVKDLLLNNGLDYDATSISSAIARLASADLLRDVGDAAIQVIDDYLTDGNEDSLFEEPEYQKTRDLNAFLKSDKLGKESDFSPHLRIQVTLTKKMLRKSPVAAKIKSALLTTA